MTLRSETAGAYGIRLACLALFFLVIHGILADLVFDTTDAFNFWERRWARFFGCYGVAFLAAAYFMRPLEWRLREESDEDDEPLAPATPSSSAVEKPAVAAPAAPVAVSAPQPTEPPPAVKPKPASVKVATKTVRRVSATASPIVKLPAADAARGARAWQIARAMQHEFVPDPIADGLYLEQVCEAASYGHSEALEKLAEYALRRGTLVERYYWLLLARCRGVDISDQVLRECRGAWASGGGDPEEENVHPFFSIRQGNLARAALDLDTGREAANARVWLKEAADAGDEEAALFLSERRHG